MLHDPNRCTVDLLGMHAVKQYRRVAGDRRFRTHNRVFLLGQDRSGGHRRADPDGTVDMNQVRVAYIGDARGGGGTLFSQGQSYPFTIAGLGVDGIGRRWGRRGLQVAGSYAQANCGFAFGTTSGGDLGMQNQAGVIMHLKAKRTGLMLSLGGDAIVIRLQ
jgi:hypothetical protein